MNLDPLTNIQTKRLANALELYIAPFSPAPGSANCLWARWRDPATSIINEGVVSILEARK